jgi:hypothetical protein
MNVKLQKIDVAQDPQAKTPEWDDYVAGRLNRGVSLPVDYTVTGRLVREIEEGSPCVIMRHTRNGKSISGVLQTSPVQSVDENEEGYVVKTQNSIYHVTVLSRAEEEQ